ncbi:hypothetical protein HGRIS_003272 [Hohenbuehelia grisea]|uniref:Uncharacterized protein n=1 Tax=Hohenbuehelia grisea TaxID=104357 RepID=A0ABR3JNY9_9AGAR
MDLHVTSIPIPSSPSSPQTPTVNFPPITATRPDQAATSDQFSASNTAYIAPPVDEAIPKARHSAQSLRFKDKHKSQPAAADGAADWVVDEREMRDRLKKEKEAREQKAKLESALLE